jgi:RNA polymerase sigma-70 factor (ECF subfamily)
MIRHKIAELDTIYRTTIFVIHVHHQYSLVKLQYHESVSIGAQ